jgi:hypothetical protein
MMTGRRIAQIQHHVFDIGKGLQPFRRRLTVDSPNWTQALAEKVSDEMTAEEPSGPANHDASGLPHLGSSPHADRPVDVVRDLI